MPLSDLLAYAGRQNVVISHTEAFEQQLSKDLARISANAIMRPGSRAGIKVPPTSPDHAQASNLTSKEDKIQLTVSQMRMIQNVLSGSSIIGPRDHAEKEVQVTMKAQDIALVLRDAYTSFSNSKIDHESEKHRPQHNVASKAAEKTDKELRTEWLNTTVGALGRLAQVLDFDSKKNNKDSVLEDRLDDSELFGPYNRNCSFDGIRNDVILPFANVQNDNSSYSVDLETETLTEFLYLRGRTFEEVDDFVASNKTQTESDSAHHLQSDRKSDCKNNEFSGALHVTPISALTSLNLPPLKCHPLTWSRAIVVNNVLVETKSNLVCFCERLGGDRLNAVYRDFKESDGISPDLILNPKTCLITTSVQLLQQSTLPGQKRHCSRPLLPKDRIARLSQKFAHVIVLISITSQHIAGSTAMTEVSAFCAAIQHKTSCTVQPIFIPLDTREQSRGNLDSWTWSCIHAYAHPQSEPQAHIEKAHRFTLIQDETVWEAFLRQCGVNPMAAQMAIESLEEAEPAAMSLPLRMSQYHPQTLVKVPTISPDGESVNPPRSTSCLARLVQMDLKQQLDQFDPLLGERAVKRMSKVLNGY